MPNISTEVIVIGAGMAGIAAAHELKQRAWEVIVLEARDRIGGRMWTNRLWPNAPVDLGASWIHGVQGNPLTELARRFKLKTIVTDYEARLDYDATGKRLPNNYADQANARLEGVLETLAEEGEKLERDNSLGQAFTQWLDRKKVTGLERQDLLHALHVEVENEYATEASDMSLWYWDQDEAFDGEDVVFPNGYDQIPQQLGANLDIRLKQVVQSVDYSGKQVTVTTSQGVFTAPHAVITLPLGVLQSGAIKFSPTLPAAKQNALKRLKMGVLDKVYLRFPEVFWPKEPAFFGHRGVRLGEWPYFFNLYPFTQQPILLAFNAGPFARQLEKLTDDQIVTRATKVVRTLFGATAPAATSWHITRWASDPFALGSYSHVPPGASGKDYDALASAVNQRLFFAGEATHRKYPSTVHGAYLSGVRAAKEIDSL